MSTEPAITPERIQNHMWRWIFIICGVAGAIFVGAIVLGQAPRAGPYRVLSPPIAGVTEAGHITVTGTIENTGDKAGSPECEATFYDSDGFALSVTTFTVDTIPAHTTSEFTSLTSLELGSNTPTRIDLDC